MRIALIHVGQESNDFNPVPTRLDDDRAFGIEEGEAVLRQAGAGSAIGGYLDAVREAGREIEIVPVLRAFAVSGDRIPKEAFDFFANNAWPPGPRTHRPGRGDACLRRRLREHPARYGEPLNPARWPGWVQRQDAAGGRDPGRSRRDLF